MKEIKYTYKFRLKPTKEQEIELNLGGGYLKWTFEKCQELALKYNTKKKDFYKNERNCHEAARRQGYLNDICEHMSSRKYNGYWTEERCHLISKKYKHRSDFQKENRSCYETARKEGWLNNICNHMTKKINIK